DHTLAPLEFALAHVEHLQYLSGHEPLLGSLLAHHRVVVRKGACTLDWDVHLADFPAFVMQRDAQALPKPSLIMFDAFSPAKTPAMWTLPLFKSLYRITDPARPCVLPTYSRSTMLRVTLLLAGFFVGVGRPSGEKEETTIAANTLDLLEEPLDRRWLQRV